MNTTNTNTVTKTCKVHGPLPVEEISIWHWRNKVFKKCRICRREASRKFRQGLDTAGLAKERERNRNYWANNKPAITKRRQQPERLAKRRAAYYRRQEYYNRQCKNKQRLYRLKLHDSYIRKILTQNEPVLTFHDMPADIIALKRSTIKIKRLITSKAKR